MPVDEPIASLGNAVQKPGGNAEALTPQRIIRIGGTVVSKGRLIPRDNLAHRFYEIFSLEGLLQHA